MKLSYESRVQLFALAQVYSTARASELNCRDPDCDCTLIAQQTAQALVDFVEERAHAAMAHYAGIVEWPEKPNLVEFKHGQDEEPNPVEGFVEALLNADKELQQQGLKREAKSTIIDPPSETDDVWPYPTSDPCEESPAED